MPKTPDFSLQGKTVIQFGGTGLLASALISALSGAGATLVVASRSRASIEDAVASERGAGRDAHAEEVDISAEASLHALRDRVLSRHARVDGIVFNAKSAPMRAFGDDLATWQDSMSINSTGFFATMRTFGDLMAAQRGGSIVNIASMKGLVGVDPSLYEDTAMTSPPDYFFHKAGMINLTRYLASHYGANRVRVNAVSPGGIYNPDSPQPTPFLERYARATMLGRMADAGEIVGAVVFLLSDAASYVTGTNLLVDGGYTEK